MPGASTEATVLEVRAQDRPGLLHELGMTFAKAGVSVRSAHIATYAGQTLDTFYVTDFSGRLLDPCKVAQVVAAVIDTCDGATGHRLSAARGVRAPGARRHPRPEHAVTRREPPPVSLVRCSRASPTA